MDEALKQLLLPLLGGFCAILVNWRLRFVALRTTGEKIFLICAVLGVLLAIAGTLTVQSLKQLLGWLYGSVEVYSIQRCWRELSPFAASDFLSFLLGPVLALAFNRAPGWAREESFKWASQLLGDNLDAMLEVSRLQRRLLLMSLRCGRVYVGVVGQLSDSMVGDGYVKFHPFLSGYRTPLDIEEPNNSPPGGVVFTTFYEEVVHLTKALSQQSSGDAGDLGEITVMDEEGRSISFDPQLLKIVVPKADIESATVFDPKIYAFLNRRVNPSAWDRLVGAPEPAAEPFEDVVAQG